MKNFSLILFLSALVCAQAYSQGAAQPSPAAAASTPEESPTPASSPQFIAPSLTTSATAPATESSSPTPATPSVSPAIAPAPMSAEATKAATSGPSSEASEKSTPATAGETPASADQSGPLPTEPDASAAGAAAAEGPKKTDEAMPDSAFTEPNSFVPEETKPTDAINLPAAKQNEAEKLRLERLNYRKAKTVVIKDAAIRSLLDQADKAQNDGDRRAAFRKYYELLDKKITKMDPSVAEYSTTMRKAQFGRLQEDRVEPTIPNNPPPTPEPAR